LYFGDETGSPGTILTFFPWAFVHRGRPGAGMVTATAFSVPENSLGYWEDRLRKFGVPAEREGGQFDEEVLSFVDPDGMRLEIVGHANAGEPHPWHDADVALEHSIRRFYSVTLSERGYEKTAELLSVMGFRKVGESGNRFRFDVGGGGEGARVDVLCVSEAPHGNMGAGSVHHVAFRVANDAGQLAWRKLLIEKDVDVTPVRDRQYFQSIYFLEPGGVLFEIATDPPGFAKDEPVEALGEKLKLPPWLEPRRSRIEGILPSIEIHKPSAATKAATKKEQL
ncbi:MAG TPA: ring-cleaving dioxygenase, partial [Candidatus Angelobacter sp.]|nr:ring-cleaving dioxygenase [Candidatus Angelobacter sp.]